MGKNGLVMFLALFVLLVACRFGQPLGQDETCVVAEGAAEVAAPGEHRAGDLSGIIQKRQLLQTRNQHSSTPFIQPCYHNTRCTECQ